MMTAQASGGPSALDASARPVLDHFSRGSALLATISLPTIKMNIPNDLQSISHE